MYPNISYIKDAGSVIINNLPLNLKNTQIALDAGFSYLTGVSIKTNAASIVTILLIGFLGRLVEGGLIASIPANADIDIAVNFPATHTILFSEQASLVVLTTAEGEKLIHLGLL